MSEVEVTRTPGPPDRWTVRVGGAPAGSVAALVRPDQRCLLLFRDCAEAAHQPLVVAVAGALDRDLYVEVDDVGDGLGRFLGLGFVENRREDLVTIPTDPARTGLDGVAPPSGFGLVSAGDVEPDQLRLLDDLLRQDVPGASGWRWDPEGFANETYRSTDFDPATYVVAVHRASGRYAGLTRVWMRSAGPRLGLVATVREYRRQGLARAMLAAVFAELDRRGNGRVSAEVDTTNVASQSLLRAAGASRVGGTVELVLPARH